jgi:hypothetical protein
MKKTTLLFSACLFSFGIAIAQVELKPAVGLTFTDVSKDPETGKAKGQVGYQIGGSVLIGNKFYIDPGIFFVKKSTDFVSEGTAANDITLNMTGIRIPVAVGYHLLGEEESLAALRILGGGSAFFVTGVDAEGADKDDFSSPTWGVFAGAGLDIWILFLDVKYEWSLSDVSSVTDFDIGKHKSLYANLGVRIKF